jgi:hypothetical protein
VKLYLDDERPAPRGWVRVDNVKDCTTILAMCYVSHLSLDHDLGEGDGTGYDVLVWLEHSIIQAPINLVPPNIRIHTANPPARLRMELAVEAIQRRLGRIP